MGCKFVNNEIIDQTICQYWTNHPYLIIFIACAVAGLIAFIIMAKRIKTDPTEKKGVISEFFTIIRDVLKGI